MLVLEHFSTLPALEAHLTSASRRTNSIRVREEKLKISIFRFKPVFEDSSTTRPTATVQMQAQYSVK